MEYIGTKINPSNYSQYLTQYLTQYMVRYFLTIKAKNTKIIYGKNAFSAYDVRRDLHSNLENMTTLTIDNPEIEQKYSSYEIQMKFLYFLEKELGEKQVDLYQISINNLPENTKARFNKVNTLNFIDY